MQIQQENIKHLNTVTHEGKVLIVATVAEPGKPVKLVYTVKQDGFEDSALQNPGGNGWEAFKELPLPSDEKGDPSVAAKELAELTYKQGTDDKYLLRSVYDSAQLTANAPVQLVSHDGYVYLFRQSKDGTLLADRLVLDGMTNTLTPRLEVRFKRSRQRHTPIKDMKINSGGQMESLDSPDFRDIDNQPFHEPSTEIYPGSLNQLKDGWFGVAVTATNEVDRYRWHIFAYNKASSKIDLLTLRAGQDSMFTVQDYWFRRIDADTDAISYDSIPGLIRRQLSLQKEPNQTLTVSNGLAVVKYDIQVEQKTQAGKDDKQWMRDSSKLLLAIPTDQGVAALSFAIAADGTLAQIKKETTTATLRSQEREILLPVNLLDKLRPVADAAPAPQGLIHGLSRSMDDDTADRLRVQAVAADAEAVGRLNLGDTVKLYDTASYNGLYPVGSVDPEEGSFTIDAPFKFAEVGVGRWQVMEDEDTGLVFDGLVTGYENAGDGKLKVLAANHGLSSGDWVQIVDTPDLGGEYPILQHDEEGFTVQRPWVNGGAVNIKLESNKRRGLVFDGQNDWIGIPLAEPLKLGVGFTFEAWVKLNRDTDQTILATELEPTATGWRATLGVNGGKFSFAYLPVGLTGETEKRLVSPSAAKLNEWVHVACAYDGTVLHLLENGKETATLTFSNRTATEYSAWIQSLTDDVNKEVRQAASNGLSAGHPALYNAVKLRVMGRFFLSARANNTVDLASLGNQLEQRWSIIKPPGSDRVIIRNLATQQVLNNNNLQLVELGPDTSQVGWILKPIKEGLYCLRSGGDYPYNLEMLSNGSIGVGAVPEPGKNPPAKQLWGFEPVGQSRLECAQAALKAAQSTTLRIPLSNTRTLTLAGQSPTGVTATPTPKPVQLLKGQLADVRVWTVGRNPKDIKNNLHLQLTGRETGLEGYWRLGGVAADEAGVPRVYDFGVNANHGFAQGAPYGGGVTLPRNLADGAKATRYGNPELFAVSEGATYVETFEFRTDPAVVDPNNADNQNGRVFKPALWGKVSRNAEEMQRFAPLAGEHYQFDPAGESGWHRATCRFIVPPGVRLLRCFEVGEVRGDWTTLEIRRHAVKWVSDTVTQSQADETAQFIPLAGATGDADPNAKLPELEGKENEEAVQVTRKKLLDEAIIVAANIEAKKRERDAQQTRVNSLLTEVTRLQAAYNREKNDPLNYWCKIVAKHSGKCLDVKEALHKDGAWVHQWDWANQNNAQWALEPVGDGYYKIKAKHSGKCLDVIEGYQHNKAWVAQWEWHGTNNQKWALESIDGGNYYRIKAKHSQKYLDVYGRGNGNGEYVCQWEWANQDNGKWKIEKVGEETINSKIQNARDVWENYQRIVYDPAAALLKNMDDALATAGSKTEATLKTERDQVIAEIASIQRQISTLTTSYLARVAAAYNKAQSMSNLANQVDPRGLKVQGALLPFAQAATRLHALESCAGRVTLSYQDKAGNLRQTHYDTVYDGDAKAEEWLPEGNRAAVKLNETGIPPSLPAAIFDEINSQITIEFWAKGGEALPKAVTFLGASNKDQAPCLRIQLPDENGMVVWEAGLASGGKPLDRLQALSEAQFYRERWTHWAFVKDCDKGEMRIYRNGKPFHKNDPKAEDSPVVLNQPIVGVTKAKLGGHPGSSSSADNWPGRLTELRIWNVALGERELEVNSLLTLSGNEPGLVAYYPMNKASGTTLNDETGNSHQFNITAAVWTPCSAPIGRVSPFSPEPAAGQATKIGGLVSAEYSRVVVDAQRRKSAMMLRCLALADAEGVRLFDEQRIEELDVKWIGNAQIKPTLIGYIEGAPPLPSENLTEEDDYNGATSVELVQSSDVSYSWTREQDASAGSEIEALLGAKSQTTAGIGVETTLEDIESGGGFKTNFAYHWQNASNVGASQSLSQSDRLELRGSQEQDAYFPQLGKRFIPKNVGYALVTSGMADVFVSKLKKSGRMVGFQVLPVEGLPLDVNTITFMINPAYTMAGSLDGMTGTRATSQRVFGQVPEMRAQFGSLYPASYLRLKEAYDLKARIDNQDRQHQAYFNQFDAGLVDETSLDSQVNDGSLDGPSVGFSQSSVAGSGVVNELQKQINAIQAEIDQLDKDNPADKIRIDTLEKQKADLEKRRQAQLGKEQGARQQDAEKRQQEIEAAHSDLSARVHATTSFAAWQRTMENLRIRAGKRNIVNTYIWDADGGFHAEEQQFASTVEHTVGGSFDMSIALGGQGKFAIAKVLVESNGYATTNMTQTMSKTEASSKGMELHVDLSGVESRGVTDHRDYPILPGEKVDRYRFMSFYLENNVDHWHDFFNQVVDPEWLASNDEEARALRQTQSALPNKVWRVLHRVTYVERPALLGFGRQQPAPFEVSDEIGKLRGQVGELKDSLAEVLAKLDKLLDK